MDNNTKDFFYDILNDQGECINTGMQLAEYICKITDRQQTSAYNYIENFMKYMYFSKFIGCNPYLNTKSLNITNLPQNIMYIHKLMYSLLRKRSTPIFSVKAAYEDNDEFDFSKPTATWNIPIAFVPFIVIYILASNKTHALCSSKTPTNLFFTTMDAYVDKKSIFSIFETTFPGKYEDFRNSYEFWKKQFLGAEYLLNLEEMCVKFAQTTDQENTLRYSVSFLTDTLLWYGGKTGPIPKHLNTLLKDYIDELGKAVESNSQSFLYRHDEDYPIYEKDYINQYIHKLNDVVKEELSIIKQALRDNAKENCKYGIGVNDYQHFKNLCEPKYLELKDLKENAPIILMDMYNFISKQPEIVKNLANKRLSKVGNERKHIDTFVPKIQKYYSDIIHFFDNFFTLVNKASDKQPEHYDDLLIGENYLKNLEDAIKSTTDRVETFIDTTCSKNSALYKYHDDGYIINHCYYYAEIDRDIANKIICILCEKKDIIPRTNISSIKKRQYTFPLNLCQFATLLEDIE